MRHKFKIGQVIKFRNMSGYWQYERIFAIGNCSRHKGLNRIRVTHMGEVFHPVGREGNDGFGCGCLGEIEKGPLPLPLTMKERGTSKYRVIKNV